MKKIILVICIFTSFIIDAQNINSKNHISYIETSAEVDSLVVPDKIYINILLDETDSKGKIPLEELEKRMITALKAANVDIETQLSLDDLGSYYRKYFLRKKDVLKSKVYQLVIYDAKTLSTVFLNLEKVKIANVDLRKVEYSEEEKLKLILKQEAIIKAKTQAENLVKPLNQTVGKAFFIEDSPFTLTREDWYPRNSRKLYFAQEAVGSPNVEIKKIKIGASVKVRFYLD